MEGFVGSMKNAVSSNDLPPLKLPDVSHTNSSVVPSKTKSTTASGGGEGQPNDDTVDALFAMLFVGCLL